MKNVFRMMFAVAMAVVPVAMAVVPVCCYKMLESPIEYFGMGSLFGMALIIIAMEVDGLIGWARENERKKIKRLLVELCMKADELARAAHKDDERTVEAAVVDINDGNKSEEGEG